MSLELASRTTALGSGMHGGPPRWRTEQEFRSVPGVVSTGSAARLGPVTVALHWPRAPAPPLAAATARS